MFFSPYPDQLSVKLIIQSFIFIYPNQLASMKNSLFRLSLCAVLLLQIAPCFAELGGTAAKEAVQIQAAIPGNPATLTVVQVKLPSGTQIREYLNVDGVVVAVSWQGATLPNLKQLLGSSFDSFVQRPAQSGNHRNASMISDDLVVQSHGQLRAFHGKAYLPKLLPAGFDINQIQ